MPLGKLAPWFCCRATKAGRLLSLREAAWFLWIILCIKWGASYIPGSKGLTSQMQKKKTRVFLYVFFFPNQYQFITAVTESFHQFLNRVCQWKHVLFSGDVNQNKFCDFRPIGPQKLQVEGEASPTPDKTCLQQQDTEAKSPWTYLTEGKIIIVTITSRDVQSTSRPCPPPFFF